MQWSLCHTGRLKEKMCTRKQVHQIQLYQKNWLSSYIYRNRQISQKNRKRQYLMAKVFKWVKKLRRAKNSTTLALWEEGGTVQKVWRFQFTACQPLEAGYCTDLEQELQVDREDPDEHSTGYRGLRFPLCLWRLDGWGKGWFRLSPQDQQQPLRSVGLQTI